MSKLFIDSLHFTVVQFQNCSLSYDCNNTQEVYIMVTMVKILVAIIKIQIFIFKIFANYGQIAELEEKLEALLKEQEEQE